MNLEFMCLITIFALLVLLITFGDCFNPSEWNYFSTGSNTISSNSIINSIKF